MIKDTINVKINNFEGPLDLLIHLIEKRKWIFTKLIFLK